MGEVKHVVSFLLDFFPLLSPAPTPTSCFLGFPESVRNLEKQGEFLYLLFSLPASHWLTSNVPQFGRYKNVGFCAAQIVLLGGPGRALPFTFSKYGPLPLNCSLAIHPYSIHSLQSTQHNPYFGILPAPAY